MTLISIHHVLIALSLGVACVLWWHEHMDAGRLGVALLCWLWCLQQGMTLVAKGYYHWFDMTRYSHLQAGEPVSELAGAVYRYCPEKQQYCYLGNAAASALGLVDQHCQLTTMAFDAMVHPDDRESLKRARRLALRRGYLEHTYRLVHGAREQKVLDRGIVLHRDGVAECHGLLMDISQFEQVSTASTSGHKGPAGVSPMTVKQQHAGQADIGAVAAENMASAAPFSMAEALPQAVADRQLRLVYQPQVHGHDQRMAGFEVLLRWPHPDQGNIPPSSFIPVAESMGLMPSLGNWIIDEVCQQISRWQAQGYHVPIVAINVSVLQLEPALLSHVAQTLARHALDGTCLEIEITESRLMQNLDECLHVISGLRQQGIRISLDDFGTGYSSLDKLALLPLDRVKLDASFVTALTGASHGYPMLEAIMRLAHSLRLKVVAEGVETPQQQHLLNELGCDILQGYLFGAGVEADTAVRYLRRDQTFESIMPPASDASSKAAIDLPSAPGANGENRF